MRGIGRWRGRKAQTPLPSDGKTQHSRAPVRKTRCTCLTWSRHPDLNWGRADYEVARHRVIKLRTTHCLKPVGLNLGSSIAASRDQSRLPRVAARVVCRCDTVRLGTLTIDVGTVADRSDIDNATGIIG